jgi:hypothetical protein
VQALDENGYKQILRIAEDGRSDSGLWDLVGLCRMPMGIAQLLVKYSRADLDRITKKEKKSCSKN